MTKLTAIAIDDEPIALRIIQNYVSKTETLQLIKLFEDVLEAELFLKENTIDLIFLDVDMPDKNGITLAQDLDRPPLIILTTAFKDYAVDGYEINAVDFLLKPFSLERFKKAVDKAIQQFQIKQQTEYPFLVVFENYKKVKINFSEIEYLESMADYVKIHLFDGSEIATLSSLKAIEEKLLSFPFIKVHRSYIVAVEAIKSYSNKKLDLQNITIPVGTNYIKAVQSFFS